jgi:outer membrane protein assembly factor BamB
MVWVMSNPLLAGHYLNPYLVSECGIPKNNQKWSVSHKDFSAMLGSWTLGSDSIYIRAPKAHRDYRLLLDTGDVVWSCDVIRNLSTAACLLGEYVCLGWYIHDIRDGRIIYDLRDSIDKAVVRSQIILPFEDGLLCRVSGERSRVVYFDIKQDCVEDYPIDLTMLRVTDDQKYLLGWSDRKICCLDAQTKDFIWSYSVKSDISGEPQLSAGFAVHDDGVYLYDSDGNIFCLDVKSGAVSWERESGTQLTSSTGESNSLKPTSIASGNGAIVINRYDSENGYVEVLSSVDGGFYWRADAVSSRVFISGDILIVICGDDPECMQMRDLFSGEVLWNMPNPLTAMIKVLAWDTKIVVSNTLGTFRCYEWSEPYRSPHLQ